MMKNVFSILTLAAAVLLGSCVKSDIDKVADPALSGQTVTFSTSGSGESATRGTPITDAAALTTMGVFCASTGTTEWTASAPLDKMSNQLMNHTAGTWSYPSGEEVYWDATSLADRYSFFAYAPYATAANGITVNAATAGVPTLTYTVPTTTADQPDLMVAVPRKNMLPTNSPVALQMKHALTTVGFRIIGEGEKLTGISITGVSLSGTLAVDGGDITWTGLGAADSTTDLSALIKFDSGKSYYTTTTTLTDVLTGDGYLMMIPQTLTSAAKVTFSFEGAVDLTIDLGTHTWAPGQKAIYQATLPVLDLGPLTWDEAVGMDKNYPQGVCPVGYRVPTQNELMMMWINYPGTPELNLAATSYWSATEDSTGNAWRVIFGAGYAASSNGETAFRVRCVRTNHRSGEKYPYVTSNSNGPIIVSRDADGGLPDGSIHPNWTTTPAHNETNAENRVGAKLQVAKTDAATSTTWNNAAAACPSGWRLPTQREMHLIWVMGGATEAKYNTASDRPQQRNPPLTAEPLHGMSGFGAMTASYWATTTTGGTTDKVWYMDTARPGTWISHASRGAHHNVRCVRDLQ